MSLPVIILVLNLSFIPIFHLEKAVAFSPTTSPLAVAPIDIIVAYSGVTEVSIPTRCIKLEEFLGVLPLPPIEYPYKLNLPISFGNGDFGKFHRVIDLFPEEKIHHK